ncbi:MAG: HlyC/CorC family transporter [Ruminococcaceae bacterium]|nr:HlyC/CorC family transporter [Oscillospiraceae bacterium]
MDGYITYILTMAVCIIMSAYFSATETAFSSINKTRLKAMAEKGNKRAALTYELSEKYDKLISTILIGNNIVNIAVASIGTVLFVKIYGDIGATISTIVVTVAVLIFGEITPKSVAKDFPERFAMFSTPLIRLFIVILTPLNFVFSAWKKLVTKLIKVQDDARMSQEELLMLVEEVQQEGSIDVSEGDLIRNAIEFNDLKAGDILTHRVDLEAVSIEDPKEEIAKVFTDTRFSRLLVYEENIDNIIGVLHQKDFYVGTGISDKPLSELIAAPVFIHKSEKIKELLSLLQRKKSHIAIVLDEYGGTLGIVTMEDILEELVGDIWDEHDEVVEDFKELSENSYRVDCGVKFDDFCRFFDIDGESDSVSLGGWIMEQLSKIPELGDEFEFEGLHISVTEADSHRVSYVTVTVIKKEEPAKQSGIKNEGK